MQTLCSRQETTRCSCLMLENENRIVDFITSELTKAVRNDDSSKVKVLGKVVSDQNHQDFDLQSLIPIVFKRDEKLILSQ